MAANFRTDRERRKWESLQNSVGTSLAKVAQGVATQNDLNAISKSLSQLSGVASNVFDEAVATAMDVARKQVADVKSVVADGLTEFEVAVNKALAKQTPDIVGQIADLIELSALEQNEATSRALSNSFSDFRRFLPPQDLPTVDDLLANNELLVEELTDRDAQAQWVAEWERREDTLLDRIFAMFQETLSEFREELHKQIPTQEQKKLRYTKRRPDLQYGLTAKALELIGQRNIPDESVADVSFTDTSTQAVTTGLSSVADSSVVPAQGRVSDLDDLYARLTSYFEGRDEQRELGPENDSHEDVREAESRKADAWWKSFADWTGAKWSGMKKTGKTGFSWLTALGKGLMAMLLTPQLWKTLVDKFNEYVTFDNIIKIAKSAWGEITDLYDKYVTLDNIKAVGGKVWDWMKDTSGAIWDWIKEKLGLKKADDKSANTMEKEATASGKALPGVKATPEELKRLAEAESKTSVAGATTGSSSGTPASAIPSNPASQAQTALLGPMPNGGNLSGTQQVPAAPASTAPTRTSVDNSSNTTINSTAPNALYKDSRRPTSNTTVNNQNQVQITPGTATPAPGSQQGAAGSGLQVPGKSPVQGTAPVNMRSFGFNPAIDDTFLLMNSGMLG
ncbi:hypothetical protein [Ralstonia phage phiRSL1]|uniref:Uncharacterized protein n=1 Tax=Ralstonia phage phiRSL1 TaxID=1980924 RepID=B2ZYI6_9CAUD|nr:hypothetical protein RSL1_ORF205 [Ralstonia phage phiRSL1]BAG41654.1 hypothetical protein [Ralstonia phage phiRSL1]